MGRLLPIHSHIFPQRLESGNNRRRVEISSSVLLQTERKLRSLRGTELSAIDVICLVGSFES